MEPSGLDRRTRLILTLGIVAGLGRHGELGIYAQGAIRNGVTVEEIKEILGGSTVRRLVAIARGRMILGVNRGR